jgi:hypothetical protein
MAMVRDAIIARWCAAAAQRADAATAAQYKQREV